MKEITDANSVNIIAGLTGIHRYCTCKHPHAYVERAEVVMPRTIIEIGGERKPLFCRVIWRCLKCGGEIYNPTALLNGGDHRNRTSTLSSFSSR